jgi:hypothetical protein
MGRSAVITQLLGGLGNQMFQYALGFRLARDFGMDLLVDTSVLEDHSARRGSVKRVFDLDLFSLSCVKASPTERWRYNAHGLPFAVRVSRRVLKPFLGGDLVVEPGFRFQPDLLARRRPPKYIAGLWQSWRYLTGREEEIRKEFTFREAFAPESIDLVERLRLDSSVAIHVRRGDYVTNPVDAATLGFVGSDYYRRAVDAAVPGSSGGKEFFVFSDEIEWCRANVDWLPGPVTFVDSSRQKDRAAHHLDFQLMAQARNFILSNSTFAWWAAWLSSATDKRVIAPMRWFNDPSLDSSDLCPPEWILV